MKIKYVNPVDGQLVEVALPRGTEIVRLEVPKVHLRKPLIVFVDHGGINVVHDPEEIPKQKMVDFDRMNRT